MQELLEEVVNQHNEVVQRLSEIQQEAAGLDAERLKLVGQAQLLEKLIAESGESVPEAPVAPAVPEVLEGRAAPVPA